MGSQQEIAKNYNKISYRDEILLKIKTWGIFNYIFFSCRHHHPSSKLLRSVYEWLIAHIEMVKHCLTLSGFSSSFSLVSCSWVLANLRFPSKRKLKKLQG